MELSKERSNLSKLDRELGIKVSLLYKWRKDYHYTLNYKTIEEFNNHNLIFKNVA